MRNLAILASVFHSFFLYSHAFVATRHDRLQQRSHTSLFSTTSSSNVVTLSLEKPLGLILEEVEEGQPCGVFVKEITDTGSAVKYSDQLLEKKLLKVCGTDVTSLDFDAVMQTIVDAPSVVEICVGQAPGEETASEAEEEFPVGTKVTLKVIQKDGSVMTIDDAKVGDNLRQTLLDNGFEVYQGLKQKLGNCGGAGQCTFCAVDVTESKGWLLRSDYEDGKLKKKPNARLACLNNIQGPATIQKV